MLRTFLRGLRMLRHAELVRRLGDFWSAEREIDEIRRLNPRARISSDAIVYGWREGMLRLASGSAVERGTMLALGDVKNGFGELTVGENTWIGPYNNLRLAGGTAIRIGKGCLIAQFCTIVAANHALSRSVKVAEAPCAPEPRDVIIGDDVWLAAGAILLPGVTVADGAVIGAGSVVTHPIGAYEIWAGNPARIIGERPA